MSLERTGLRGSPILIRHQQTVRSGTFRRIVTFTTKGTAHKQVRRRRIMSKM